MKRDEHLIPLTHDHHHALVQAKRLRKAAAAAPDQRNGTAREFVDFYEKDTLLHFREEEEVVFPLVVDHSEAQPALVRLLIEHLRIHALVAELRGGLETDGASGETMSKIAGTLEAHIRFEEKTMFPLIERLAGAGLAGVELESRDRSVSPGAVAPANG